MKITLNREPMERMMKKARRTAAEAAGAARVGVYRAEETVGKGLAYSRLSRLDRDLQGQIDTQLKKVGEMIYATHCGDPTDSDDIQKVLEQVDALREEQDEYRRRMRELRGAHFCPDCGAENRSGSLYCQECGRPLEWSRSEDETNGK